VKRAHGLKFSLVIASEQLTTTSFEVHTTNLFLGILSKRLLLEVSDCKPTALIENEKMSP